MVLDFFHTFAAENKNKTKLVTNKIHKIMNKKETSVLVALAAIALNNKEGFTVDAATLQPIKSGYAVAVADTQDSFGFEGLKKVVKYISEHPEINAFGGWYNTENNMYYFDATIIVKDLEAAIDLGRIHRQIAIYDLTNGLPIEL